MWIRGASAMRLTPPAPKTLIVSLLLVALAFVQRIGLSLPIAEFWTLMTAFGVLLVGNLFKGI
jgi:hypothetical protein